MNEDVYVKYEIMSYAYFLLFFATFLASLVYLLVGSEFLVSERLPHSSSLCLPSQAKI